MHRPLRAGALIVAGALILAGCSSGGSPSPSSGVSEPPTSGEPTASGDPQATELPGTKEFTVAFTSPGLSSAPFLAAIAALNEQGYSIDVPILTASELVTGGLASGDFAFGSAANNAMLAAFEQGANIKAVTTRVANEWALYATTDIQDCADLDGKRLAIHSEGAVSTAMVRAYLEENCPDAEPTYIIVEGSPNRVAALLAGQIDASPVELADAITIDAEGGDRFHLLASLAEDVPLLQPQSVWTNGDFAAENPGSVLAMVKAILEQHRMIEGDPAYLQQIAEEHVPDAINAETIAEACELYVELNMFPADGGLTQENLQYMAEFFGPDGTGSTSELLDPADFADLSFQEMALEQLGN